MFREIRTSERITDRYEDGNIDITKRIRPGYLNIVPEVERSEKELIDISTRIIVSLMQEG